MVQGLGLMAPTKQPVSVLRFSMLHEGTGSVRFGSDNFPVRRGSACAFRTRCGSVRFGSVRFRFRFRPVPELRDSVRFGSVRPVRFGFLFLLGNIWQALWFCYFSVEVTIRNILRIANPFNNIVPLPTDGIRVLVINLSQLLGHGSPTLLFPIPHRSHGSLGSAAKGIVASRSRC